MSSQFARLRGALDRVGTTTPGTIVGVFAEDLTAIMNHYVEVVREAAELKAARAQPAQAGQVLTDEEIQAAWVEHGLDDCTVEDFARAIEQAVLAKRVPMPPEDWSVFNSGAEVASGLTWAEAWDYMTPSRIERGWTAVCVANKSNIGIVGEKGGE